MLLGEPGRLTKLRVVVAMGSSRRGSESGKGTPKNTKRQAKVKETAKQEKIRKKKQQAYEKSRPGCCRPRVHLPPGKFDHAGSRLWPWRR